MNLYTTVKYDITKDELIDIFKDSKLYGCSIMDTYLDAVTRVPEFGQVCPIEEVNSNSNEYRVPKDLFDRFKFPFDPLVFQFFEYNNSDHFTHKDGRVKSRLGIRLMGEGDLIFYDEDKTTEIGRTDLNEWTIFDTQHWHKVEKNSYRLSLVVGFTQSYQELYDWFATEGLVV